MNAVEFYASICACDNTPMQCPGVVNSSSIGCPPRGFFTEVACASVPILAVCKNPGHPLPDEAAAYKARSGAEIAKNHFDYARITFYGGSDHTAEAKRSTTFHKNLLRYAAFILDVPESEVFKSVAYTNLVKCSTTGERDLLKSTTMKECYRRHFSREITYFRPKVLLAFGREVERFLNRAKAQGAHSLPVIYVKHPSYYYRRDQRDEKLSAIKTEVRRYTNI